MTWKKGKGDQLVGQGAFPRVPNYNPAYESPSCETRVVRTDRRVDLKGNVQTLPFRHLRRGLDAHQAHHGQFLSIYPAVQMEDNSRDGNKGG